EEYRRKPHETPGREPAQVPCPDRGRPGRDPAWRGAMAPVHAHAYVSGTPLAVAGADRCDHSPATVRARAPAPGARFARRDLRCDRIAASPPVPCRRAPTARVARGNAGRACDMSTTIAHC